MPNVHTPERLIGESLDDYKARQRCSRRSMEHSTLRGQHTPPGRKALNGREALRNSQRENGTLNAGSFGRGLRNVISAKARKVLEAKPMLRDEHGAYTLTGRDPFSPDVIPQHARRIWLAGISAQRGY